MKKLFLFLAVASTTMFVSCSDDDSKKNDPDAATSIVLASNLATIELGQSVTFTVTDSNAEVVTSESTILVNNVEIDGTTFTPDEVGTYTIKANYKNTNSVTLMSNEITVVVTEPIPAATSIVLTSTESTIELGGTVTFTVTNNNAVVVTGNATILVNDTAIEGNTWTPDAAGTFSVKATHTNSNDVVLTSNTVTVVVNPVSVPSDYSIVYNGTNIPVTAGDIIYWGAYYTDETQTDVVEIFALATHDGDLGVASPANLSFVDFTMPYSETEAATPVAGSYNWIAPFTGLREIQLKVNASPITIAAADINSVAVNIGALELLGGGDLTMTYSVDASFGTSTLTTSGSGAGKYYDASAKPAGKSGKKEVFDVKKFNAKKAQFLASKAKKLKK